LKFYSNNVESISQHLKTDLKNGLTSQEVELRLSEHGKNVLNKKKSKTTFQRFLEQFKDAMIIILLVAALISFVIACVEKNPKEFFEPALILLIVILNATMGVIQENKAEKAMEALQNLSAPHSRVIRNGKEEIIDASLLVPGDLIRLEAGDFVPADARLISSVNLKCEESALTGESVPAEKNATKIVKDTAPLGDRVNMIYSGCSVTYGTALAIVTATGMNTEMGKIANLLDSEGDSQTPLQKKLAQLGKYLGLLAIGVCAIIFIVGLVSGMKIMDIFMTAVSLAVSAIPEGLPAIVTVVLSIGVTRLAKKNAIIRKLPAVETLGGASVICSDKTGTLTQNRMTLTQAWITGMQSAENISQSNSPDIKQMLAYATLCCDGSVQFEGEKAVHIGDPTETAIIFAAHGNGILQSEINKKYPRIGAIPFDSNRKLMTSINYVDDKKLVIVKGAFDMLAKRCIQGDIENAKKINDEMAASALRVIAVAYKVIDNLPQNLTSDEIENDLTFMGLVGMIDPPRIEAAEAVRICRIAGIRPVMITGDHVVTASAIAKQLGILQPGHRAITGVELDAMSDEELDRVVTEISVYARVSPENKIRIVKAWQRRGEVVAMTGDGVNDAPALKAADIGCAMGITGTDVAKGAADMTLADDNFATIVDAVKEGRGIYTNIKKVVGFLLGTNIGEVFCVFFAMLIWQEAPLLSMQLLWINLITDSLPAIALGMEPLEKDVMKHKPRPSKESLFAHGYGVQLVLQGAMFGALSLAAYAIGKKYGGGIYAGRTLAFMVLALSQIVQSYNMRSGKSLFKTGFFTNSALNKAAITAILLMAVIMFIPPIAKVFGLIRLDYILYLVGLGLIILPFVIMELAKALGLVRHHVTHKDQID